MFKKVLIIGSLERPCERHCEKVLMKDLFEKEYGLLYDYEHDYFNDRMDVGEGLTKISNRLFEKDIIINGSLVKYLEPEVFNEYNSYYVYTNDIFDVPRSVRCLFDSVIINKRVSRRSWRILKKI
jgi:hypothetical protein